MKGFGTVVSGTLIAGTDPQRRRGRDAPGQRSARVRGIQVHGGSVDGGARRPADGAEPAAHRARRDRARHGRGPARASSAPTSTFDVELELLPRRRRRSSAASGCASTSARRRSWVTSCCSGRTCSSPARPRSPRCYLERPTFALPGDRFIVRQYSPMVTLGGGEIVDARPGRHRRSDRAVPEALRAFQAAPLDERIATLVERAGARAIDMEELVGRLGVEPRADRARRSTSWQPARHRPRRAATRRAWWWPRAVFDAAAGAVVGAVAQFHAVRAPGEGHRPGKT